ncbi:MAG: cadmium-translocating P-type ATPase [Oscillospiraceae bacterium]|nr:cadmium-translocating P-type ATPase [Oscillospiraceae bacterium]
MSYTGGDGLSVFLIFLACYLCVGGEVIIHAVKNILKGQVFDENFLMCVASIGAFAIGEYPEGAAVMLLYQIGEAFQEYAVERSERSITSLMNFRPEYANLVTDNGIVQTAPESVKIGDVISVKTGERIPLDGVVSDGTALLDTSAMTGESIPVEVRTGDEIMSGCVNTNGLLTITVAKTFGESAVSRILALVEDASEHKSRTENFITKFARYYTPAVCFGALALAIIPSLIVGDWAEWIHRALVFLVVSCPCALVISVPLSYFAGLGRAAKRGILVKGGNYLDALCKTDTVVFDKTGTLTMGKPVFISDGIAPETLKYAASLEWYSTHPVAKAVAASYTGEYFDVTDYTETAGNGATGIVNGKRVDVNKSGIFIDKEKKSDVVVTDKVKPDSANAIARLKALNVKRTVMLSGDKKSTAEAVGREVGLDIVRAELLPSGKVAALEDLMATKPTTGSVIYAGDGINDAPVLIRADVGLAMGGVGSDIAIEAADIVLMTDEPSKIADTIVIARETRSIVIQNIVFALGVKVIVLALSAFGLVAMWAAVFADVGVALLATLNAIRKR